MDINGKHWLVTGPSGSSNSSSRNYFSWVLTSETICQDGNSEIKNIYFMYLFHVNCANYVYWKIYFSVREKQDKKHEIQKKLIFVRIKKYCFIGTYNTIMRADFCQHCHPPLDAPQRTGLCSVFDLQGKIPRCTSPIFLISVYVILRKKWLNVFFYMC